MATSEKLPTGFYRRGGIIYLRTDPGTGKARSTGCKTLSGALAFLEERERKSRNPVHEAASRATFGIWAARICQIKRRTKSEATGDMYDVKVGHLVRILGAKTPMDQITANEVDRFIGQRQGEGVKNTTIQRELSCLSQLLRHARRAGEYPFEMSEVKPIGFSANYIPRNTYLPMSEFPALLAGLNEKERAWVCLAIATAGDISDVERVEPEDYDPKTQTILMRGTKNRYRSTRIPVPDPYVELVELALPHLPLAWSRVSHELPERCVKLGLTRVTPKDLRRTGATWLQESGVEIGTLSKFLRHGGVKTTHDVYAQARPEALGEVIRGQLQKRDSNVRPLGGMADAGDLKATSPRNHTAKTATNRHVTPSHDTHKPRGVSADPLQLVAEARVRRLSAAAAVAPEEFALPLALAKCVVESYHVAGGDEEAGELLHTHLNEARALSDFGDAEVSHG